MSSEQDRINPDYGNRCGRRAIGSVTNRARSFPATKARCGATRQDAVESLIRRCARRGLGTEPARTNAIIRIGSACFLAYPGLTIIVGGAGAIPETDSVRASADAGVYWRPARSAGRCGTEDGSADTDRDEHPHVSLLLKGVAVKHYGNYLILRVVVTRRRCISGKLPEAVGSIPLVVAPPAHAEHRIMSRHDKSALVPHPATGSREMG
jgi:hypothetical protein